MKIGMGWLGWSEDQTLDTSIYAIELALDGYVERNSWLNGGPWPALGKPEIAEAVVPEEAPIEPQRESLTVGLKRLADEARIRRAARAAELVGKGESEEPTSPPPQ